MGGFHPPRMHSLQRFDFELANKQPPLEDRGQTNRVNIPAIS